jgi:hypothetical protein
MSEKDQGIGRQTVFFSTLSMPELVMLAAGRGCVMGPCHISGDYSFSTTVIARVEGEGTWLGVLDNGGS